MASLHRRFFSKLDLAIDGDDHFFQKIGATFVFIRTLFSAQGPENTRCTFMGTNSCRNNFINLGFQCRI